MATHGIQFVLAVFAGFMFAGTICTVFIPETKNKTLEELGGDDEECNDDTKQASANF